MPQPTKDTYRSLFRGFRLFGGVQVFNALVAVVRGKFVAMILGAAGMGINALYNSASLTLQRIASLGLNLAIVKEISAADEADCQQREAGVLTDSAVAHSLAAINRLLLATALGGLIICVLAAPVLSKLTFGNTLSAGGFRVLGVALFFMVSSAGKLAILQGLQQTKLIARASVVGGLTGLFIGVPLYWFLGTSGIVPA
ncbi:MAG: O-antigen translocase, partial [Muribaculaceae bacterium]|nr:O-antigen translocase [Muribaculaceae bacterium]